MHITWETSQDNLIIKATLAECQWLTPVIISIWEAGVRRIVVQSQPRQIVCKILSQKIPNTKQDCQSDSNGSTCLRSVRS
jgi:hypothetical protein